MYVNINYEINYIYNPLLFLTNCSTHTVKLVKGVLPMQIILTKNHWYGWLIKVLTILIKRLQRELWKNGDNSARIFTVITLLLYRSVMILAPVIAKENQKKAKNFIYPEKSPISRPAATNIKNCCSWKRVFFRGANLLKKIVPPPLKTHLVAPLKAFFEHAPLTSDQNSCLLQLA